MEGDNNLYGSLLFGAGSGDDVTTYEEALFACGFGKFHLLLLFLCGWAVSSDAIEILSVSFLLPSATCDLRMTSVDKGWLNSVVFVGMLIGGYVWGSLSDTQGRRNILIWSLLCNGIANLGSSLAQQFWLFLIFRLISGIGVGGSMPVVFTYFTEFQHKDKRGTNVSILATFWMGGNIVAAGLAWLVIPIEELSVEAEDFSFHSWRVFVALCTVPSISSALFFLCMPESPKFLLQRERPEEAKSVLRRVHRTNGSILPLRLKSLILTDEDVESIHSLHSSEGYKILHRSSPNVWHRLKQTCSKLLTLTAKLFKPPLTRITVVLLMINFTLAFGYYGLFLWFPELFNRISKYGGDFCDIKTGNGTETDEFCDPPSNDLYLDGFLTSISNLPGNIITILLVDRIGRKPLLVGSMVLSGLSVFLLWLMKTRWQNVLMSCLFGAISVAGFNMLDVLQTELFPTDVRSTAFGVQTCALRIGAILGNIVFGLLVDVYCAIPMILVAVLLVFGGLASIALPNTTKKDIH